MKKKAVNRLIALILILALAAIGAGGYFAYTFLSPMKTTIYVFNDDYKSGTMIRKDMLSSMQVDAKIVATAKEGDVSMQYVTVSGLDTVLASKDTLLRDVTKGTALMPWLLATNGGGAIENNLGDNHVAVTVPVNNYSGVTRELRVGSHVNIYSNSTYDTAKTYLLLEDMTIIDVQRDNNGALSGATFECTQEQALVLIHANMYETLYCGLIDEGKYKPSIGEEKNEDVDADHANANGEGEADEESNTVQLFPNAESSSEPNSAPVEAAPATSETPAQPASSASSAAQ